MPDAVANRAVPVRGGELSRDAAGAAGEIRCGPVADELLIDESFSAHVGAVAAVATHPRFDQMFPASDCPRPRRRLQVHACQRIGRRSASRQPLRAQRFELRRGEGERHRERRLVRRPVRVVFPPGDDACDSRGTERQNHETGDNPDQDLE